VGFVVSRPHLLLLINRKDRYVALDSVALSDGRLTVAAQGAAWDGSAAKRLGLSWDDTVIWMGMPVHTRSGANLGIVRDALFDPKTGRLSALGLSGGMTADLALGVRDLDASLVSGFDGDAVVVSDEAASTEASGGAAAVAGRGAAVGAKAMGEAAKKAALYGKAAATVASQSKAGKKAMGWLASAKDRMAEAMRTPDDK